jgi:hypothetical protein
MTRRRRVHGHVGEILSVAVERVAYALYGWRGVEVALHRPSERCLVPIESSTDQTHALDGPAMGTDTSIVISPLRLRSRQRADRSFIVRMNVFPDQIVGAISTMAASRYPEPWKVLSVYRLGFPIVLLSKPLVTPSF